MNLHSAFRAALAVVMAASVVVACAQQSSQKINPYQSLGQGTGSWPAQGSATEQLAAFRLQVACAGEARSWFKERLREGGGDLSGNGQSMQWSLVQYHYSLPDHGCYAVVEILTNLKGHDVVATGDELQLYEVDADQIGEVSVTGGHIGAEKHPMAIKQCWVKALQCSNLADWAALALPYVGNVDLSFIGSLLPASKPSYVPPPTPQTDSPPESQALGPPQLERKRLCDGLRCLLGPLAH